MLLLRDDGLRGDAGGVGIASAATGEQSEEPVGLRLGRFFAFWSLPMPLPFAIDLRRVRTVLQDRRVLGPGRTRGTGRASTARPVLRVQLGSPHSPGCQRIPCNTRQSPPQRCSRTWHSVEGVELCRSSLSSSHTITGRHDRLVSGSGAHPSLTLGDPLRRRAVRVAVVAGSREGRTERARRTAAIRPVGLRLDRFSGRALDRSTDSATPSPPAPQSALAPQPSAETLAPQHTSTSTTHHRRGGAITSRDQGSSVWMTHRSRA